MTAATAIRAALDRLSGAQVEALIASVREEDSPPQSLSEVAVGGSPGAQQAVLDLLAAWAATPGLTGDGIAVALDVGAELRRDAAARRTTPVWTGPRAAGEHRLTGGTIHGLLSNAQKRVLLVSYATHTLPTVAADLVAAVRRGCKVDVVAETAEDNPSFEPGSTPFAEIEGITRWRWPKDVRPVKAALHAKLLVIDGTRALVGSANLTAFALERNLEAGVLIRDPSVAGALERHVRALMDDETLCPV